MKLFLQKTKKLGFFKKGNFREYFKNHGSSVIKEFLKKQGILKPGNFRTFKKHILELLKTYFRPFKKPNFTKNTIKQCSR